MEQSEYRNISIRDIWDKLFISIMVFLGISFSLIRICGFCPDNDAYFLIATGREILSSGKVPIDNIWTWHEGLKIIVQQWTVCVLNAYTYDTFGRYGLLILTLILTLWLFITLHYFIKQYIPEGKFRGIVFFISSILCMNLYCTRPQIFSCVIMLTEIMVCETFYDKKIDKQIYFLILPILSILLINIHAAMWFMLFLIPFAYACPDINKLTSIRKIIRTIKEEWSNIWSTLFPLIPMFIVGLLNPNGIKGITYVYDSFTSGYYAEYINEMQPVNCVPYMIFPVITTVIYTKYKRFTKLPHIYLAIGLYILALMNQRSMWMMLIPVIQCTGCFIKGYYIQNKRQGLSRISELFFVLIFIVPVINILLSLPKEITKLPETEQKLQPIIETLSKEDKEGMKLYNNYFVGPYLEMNGYKVHIDARAESYMKKINGVYDYYNEFCNVGLGNADMNEFMEKYDFTHILVTTGEKGDALAAYMLNDDRYETICKTEDYILYRKKGLKNG